MGRTDLRDAAGMSETGHRFRKIANWVIWSSLPLVDERGHASGVIGAGVQQQHTVIRALRASPASVAARASRTPPASASLCAELRSAEDTNDEDLIASDRVRKPIAQRTPARANLAIDELERRRGLAGGVPSPDFGRPQGNDNRTRAPDPDSGIVEPVLYVWIGE
jgi:hypothetical protein